MTGNIDKQLEGEFAIFERNPLIKKPGATYNFDELCGLEANQMNDNAYEFDKRILYQQINKVANCAKVHETKAEHPEFVYYFECA